MQHFMLNLRPRSKVRDLFGPVLLSGSNGTFNLEVDQGV